MFVYKRNRRLVSRRYVVGSGLLDWISSAVGTAAKVISANKDTIKNVASVVGKVANAGATTVSATKQIVDAIRAKRLPPAAKKVLTDKSTEYLNQLASSAGTTNTAVVRSADINSRIAGAGFKTLN